jgi:translation initiation factor 2B subunit (eIF-2B alpha/beta/delta family)
VADPKGDVEVGLQQAARALRQARFLVISADAILRNGGLLCRSGGLMLAVAAKELGVPVVAVSRNYCLWDHVISSQ